MNKSKEPSREFIIACGNPTKELEFLEKALNEKSFFVLPPIAWPRVYRVRFGWDTVFGALFIEELTDGSRPICFIRHDNGAFD